MTAATEASDAISRVVLGCFIGERPCEASHPATSCAHRATARVADVGRVVVHLCRRQVVSFGDSSGPNSIVLGVLVLVPHGDHSGDLTRFGHETLRTPLRSRRNVGSSYEIDKVAGPDD